MTKLNSEDGFPHSEICGSKVAHTSPQLIAACHVLHRLCMPRHPPIALTSRLRIHTTIDNPACIDRRRYIGGLVYTDPSNAREDGPAQLDNQFMCELPINLRRSPTTASISRTHSQCQRSGQSPYLRSNRRIRFLHSWKDGGAYRDRTDDLKLAKLALSQLS